MRYLKFISCFIMILFMSATISSASFEARDSFDIQISTASDPLFFVNLLPGTAQNGSTRIATGENQSLTLNYGRLPRSMIDLLPANDFRETLIIQNKSTSEINVTISVIATNRVGSYDLEDIYYIYRMTRMILSKELAFKLPAKDSFSISTFVFRGVLETLFTSRITYPSGTYTGHLLIEIDDETARTIPISVTLP